MVFLFATVLFLLFVGLFGFMITNIDYTTNVTLLNRDYHDVPLIYVVITCVTVGAAATGIIALFEGAKTRLDNRRLRKECRKLETELNYFRTQPGGERGSVSASIPPSTPAPVTVQETPAKPGAPASAPVYDAGSEDPPDEPDDNAYSGGRAV